MSQRRHGGKTNQATGNFKLGAGAKTRQHPSGPQEKSSNVNGCIGRDIAKRNPAEAGFHYHLWICSPRKVIRMFRAAVTLQIASSFDHLSEGCIERATQPSCEQPAYPDKEQTIFH
jgi:hypothetical protein